MEMQLDFFKQTQNIGLHGILEHEFFQMLNPKIVRKFWIYHEKNPHVFNLFLRFSKEMKAAGRGYFGAQSIIERMRWFTNIETKGDLFKISNDYASCYSRLVMVTFPEEFKDFFVLKYSRTQYLS